MKRLKIISVFVIAFVAIVNIYGCQNEEQGMKETFDYEQISGDEAKKLMETETNYIILDVRTYEEYNTSHITGAICIPNETITDTEPKELPDEEQLILVYCRSGNRSKQAAAKLAKLGYNNVKEFGGINDWEYETVVGDN